MYKVHSALCQILGLNIWILDIETLYIKIPLELLALILYKQTYHESIIMSSNWVIKLQSNQEPIVVRLYNLLEQGCHLAADLFPLI